ncbi:MAG: (2Fe-2S)-binding protein [Candidatus Thioglobus sp.]|nr:MAG: (2Fe-2S)-binding protein [Candidatus Thioglobus sp.]
MFRPRTNLTDPVNFSFEGRRLTASRGDTIAAALLGSGVFIFRESAVSGIPRGPFCMIGNCYECFVQVGAMGVVQACLTEITEGMQISKVSNSIDESEMGIKEISKR